MTFLGRSIDVTMQASLGATRSFGVAPSGRRGQRGRLARQQQRHGDREHRDQRPEGRRRAEHLVAAELLPAGLELVARYPPGAEADLEPVEDEPEEWREAHLGPSLLAQSSTVVPAGGRSVAGERSSPGR